MSSHNNVLVHKVNNGITKEGNFIKILLQKVLETHTHDRVIHDIEVIMSSSKSITNFIIAMDVNILKCL